MLLLEQKVELHEGSTQYTAYIENKLDFKCVTKNDYVHLSTGQRNILIFAM